MKYMENGSLKHLIEEESKSQSPHEYDNTAKQIILCGVAHGMMTLHSRRVLHRDLKPDNVLIDSNYHPYITDFGLSKFLDPDNSKSQSMSGCGTIFYMAPEVFSDVHYGPKTDVYAFGILMYEVLLGQTAYPDELKKKKFNRHNFETRVMNGDRPKMDSRIKESFQELIGRCWSSNVRERPTFQKLFTKLSLSLDDDDESIECSINRILSGDREREEQEQEYNSRYCLDDVDINEVLTYAEEINDYHTETNNNDNKRIIELTQQIQHYQQEIQSYQQENREIKKQNQNYQQENQDIKKQNQNYQQEIEDLKIQLKEMNDQKKTESRSKKRKHSHTKISSTTPNQSNPDDGLSIGQIRSKVEKEKLQEITIPSSITSIGGSSFYSCESLTQITIPSSVTSIGSKPFAFCYNLSKINVDSQNPNFVAVDGILFTKDIQTIICYPEGKKETNYTIPSSVTSIGDTAFYDCKSLTQITIPSSVTSIGDSAFDNCKSLTQITIPLSVTSISNYTFHGCESLRQITVSSTLTSIGEFAFRNCKSLTQIAIPTVTSIGIYAFAYCRSLTKISISSLASIGFSAFVECNALSNRSQLESTFGSRIFQSF